MIVEDKGAKYEIDERMVRIWFMKVELEQAVDTLNVCQGIIETRKQFQPTRKKRSDVGKPRTSDGKNQISLKELGKP